MSGTRKRLRRGKGRTAVALLGISCLLACGRAERGALPAAGGGALQSLNTPAPAVRCRESTPTVELDSIGPLYAGMMVSELRSRCPGVVLSQLQLRASTIPVAVAALGEVVVVVEFEDTMPTSRALRLRSSSVAARTPDGIGPGVSLDLVAASWEQLEVLARDDGVIVKTGLRDRFSLRVQTANSTETYARIRDALQATENNAVLRSFTVMEIIVVALR